VRQDSELWSALHQGVLTTGKLNAALGLYHPRVSPRLLLPQVGRWCSRSAAVLAVLEVPCDWR
jgi:hypothetical protein